MNEPHMTRSDRVLTAIRDFWRVHGYGPSIRDVGLAAGLTSTNGTRYWLHKLRKDGWILWDHRKPRTLRTTERVRV